MILRDITEQVEVQGKVVVKQWDEENETYNILAKTGANIFNDNVLDMEIKFMYAVDNTLMIEVE